jgi:hypothetical protein
MPGEVTREEFEARVGEIVAEVEGEKVVSRYILEQSRRNGDDLAVLKSRMDRFESELRQLREEGRQTRDDVRQLRDEGRQLRRDLPGIVGETMREVLRERDGG